MLPDSYASPSDLRALHGVPSFQALCLFLLSCLLLKLNVALKKLSRIRIASMSLLHDTSGEKIAHQFRGSQRKDYLKLSNFNVI
jgi:hypothetical protein